MTFSERHGFEEPKMIQAEEMDDDLKNSIWNVLHKVIFKPGRHIFSGKHIFLFPNEICIDEVPIAVWTEFFKETVNSLPISSTSIADDVLRRYKEMPWYGPYELVEFVCEYFATNAPDVGGRLHGDAFVQKLNSVLEREMSGYRLVGGEITPITDPIEMEAVAEAMKSSSFSKASQRMREAVRALSDRENPNYRQAMETAWFAVDSCIKEITGVEQGGFAKIMNKLESENEAQHHFCESIKNLYSFANKAGIRHAKGDVEPKNLTAKQLALINFDNAKFFVVFCSAFMNYLKTRLPAEK